MPVVACPSCGKPVTLPDPPAAPAYACPFCRRPVPAPAAVRDSKPKVAAFDFDDEGEDAPPPRPPRRPSGNPVGDFLTFRLMITPWIIQVAFWLGVVGCLGLGVQIVTTGIDASDKPGQKSFGVVVIASGVLTALLGPLLVRIYCELAIIFFKIHDELKEMNDRTRHRP
jgi:hypothetical protein